uniref:Uncharacterized protein n=1 Tax=Magallana gigas TaxID=29159 RepID=A0A8W8HM24_MAGGI
MLLNGFMCKVDDSEWSVRKSAGNPAVFLGMEVRAVSIRAVWAQWAVLLALKVPAVCKGQSQIEEPRQLRLNPLFIELMGLKVNAKRSADDPGTPHNMMALTTDRPSIRTTKTDTNSPTIPPRGDASSREDSEDDFDHELAIIFGAMLGAMLLVFFCYGVVRCYRQEKVEFNKTQQNFTG